MGLTHKSTGKGLKNEQSKEILKDSENITVALAGNPNVGKSTLFNSLTGMNQHTGNWGGKTVGCAEGFCKYGDSTVRIIDLPGTYSLNPHSAEESVARDFICSDVPDCIAVVCDATCLERNLILVLQTLKITSSVIVCVNLLDEAKKKGIEIDTEKLSELLGTEVIGMSARSGDGTKEAAKVFSEVKKIKSASKIDFELEEVKEAEKIAKMCVKRTKRNADARDRKIDKIITGKYTGFPIMFLLLAVIFWITIIGANYPSGLLADFLFGIQGKIYTALLKTPVPVWLTDLLILGVFKTLAWVVAVMLPPMAIFFPLFTLLEDLGYLPRVAFNLDRCFNKCDACGKQALTMCMGFGCNAAGVVGCRIIDSKRERLIAMLTNVFVPCNGRFPTIIALISIFFVTASGFLGSFVSALILAAIIILGIFITFGTSKILSKTVLKGAPSSFTLELPPYRSPQIGKVIVRSILDRTIYILGRAVAVAAPAGLIIWILANVHYNDSTLLKYCTDFLDPVGKIMGLDGVIVFAFILAIPANEIVIPTIIMAYSSAGSLTDYSSLSELGELLKSNGWNVITAVCVIIFIICHFPCSTTLLTIQKESGKFKWTALAALLPTSVGIILCIAVNLILKIFI